MKTMNNEKLIPSPDFMYKQAKEAFELLELKKKQKEEQRPDMLSKPTILILIM